MVSSLSLYLLGSPRVEHAGSPIRINRRKAVALLAYLAVTGSGHSREALATLLWPESEPRRAFAYLRNALWVLNQTPVGEWLDVQRESVGLKRGDDLWLDVEQFRGRLAACQGHNHPESELCSACLSPLAEAVDLYRGDFIAGFSLGDSLTFDEWQLFETEALQRELLAALEKLVRFHGAQDEFEPAIAYARRWLSLDRLNELAQRHLMTLHARSGQRAAALRQYEDYAHALQKDLGLTPGQEITELHQRILAGEVGPDNELHNLPTQLTPFVGRHVELADIHRLLKKPQCHLLTVVGLGGSGKTRLAIQAASEWVGAFPDGVFFVPLAPVSAPDFMVSAIADALHISLSHRSSEAPPVPHGGFQALLVQLLDYLHGKQMLLVLDNVEHLLERIDLIDQILKSASGVKVLVTSRERLNLSGEWVFEIAGLRFPTEETEPDTYETFGAVQLFLHSARRADAVFFPTATDMAAVARICQLVDGIPLAVELAAAWVKVLSCPDIAREIEVNLDFLTTSLRDVPERHRSLRAVFEQSWALLSGDGRACFRKLAVFRSGFTREAAEDVARASLAALSSLVDKSLLRRTSAGRYELHELLRGYAEERLEAVPRESDVVRDRHCEHYLALLQRLEAALKGHGQKAALDELSQEVENLRIAWRWAVSRTKFEEIRRAALSLFLFYDIRSRFQEGAEMFREAATALSDLVQRDLDARAAEENNALLGLLLTIQGWFLRFSAPVAAKPIFQQGLQVLAPLGPGEELAFANVLFAFGDRSASRKEAETRLSESLAVFEANDDHWGMAVALEALSGALVGQDNAAAERYAQQSLELRRALGDRWGIALALYMLGRVAENQGMLQVAQRRYQESMQLRRELGVDVEGIVGCLDGMARVACTMGDYDRARRLYLESLALAQEMGSRWRTAWALGHLGLVAYDLEGHAEAKRCFEESLALFEELGAKTQTAFLILDLGNVALALGDFEEARRCYEQSLAIEPCNPWTFLGLGRLSHALGDEGAARGNFQHALRYARDRHAHAATLEALIEVAQLRLESGAPESALELLAVVLNQRALSHRMTVRAERLLTDAAEFLPTEQVEAAIAKGKACELGSAVDEILESIG